MNTTPVLPNEKNDTVVVWLDFGPYAYINFGIILALSKLEHFNIIGIATTKHDVDFFQNQQLVSFHKLLYYPDCYIGKTSFDLDKLKNYEKQLGINIWLDVFAERSFYKYWTDFHKFTREEILSIVEHSITFFLQTLETYKPKMVLMQQVGENISNLLLYTIAKNLGITTLMPNQLYLRDKILISDNLINREISNEFQKLSTTLATSSEVYGIEFIQKQDRSKSIDLLLQGSDFQQSLLQRISHYLKRLFNDPDPVYKNIGKTKLKLISHRIRSHFDAKKRKQFLDLHSIKSVKDKKFFYFPLSSEPEARILTTSPFHTNQTALIENIAKSIPIDSLLYVKEHPVQKLKLWRPISDYKIILDIPNVRLVHPDVKNSDLISQSQAVIAISGGTGFESLFYQKPVILFADEYYDVLPMVTKIKSFTTMPDDIKNALSNFRFDKLKFAAFMHAFDKHSLSVPYHSMMTDGTILSNLQGFVHSNELTANQFVAYYKKFQSHFELIAQSIHSKI